MPTRYNKTCKLGVAVYQESNHSVNYWPLTTIMLSLSTYSQIPHVQPWLRHGTRHTRLSCWLTNKGNIFVTSQTSAEIETLRLAFQPNKKNICWFISSDWSHDLADADEIKCLITTVTACQSCHIQGIWLDCCSILRDDKKDHGGMVNLQQQKDYLVFVTN